MEQQDIIQTAAKLAAYAVQRRKGKIKVEAPAITYSDLRAYLDELQIHAPSPPSPSPEFLALLSRTPRSVPEAQENAPEPAPAPAGAGVACIPCTVSHIAACAGQLNEAIRFAREDIASPEVGVRIDNCLSEIAAAERIDLAPSNVVNLPDAERKIANEAAQSLRKVRHSLEWYKTYDELEQAAALMSQLQRTTSEAWRQARLSRLSPEQTQELIELAKASAEKMLASDAEPLDKG